MQKILLFRKGGTFSTPYSNEMYQIAKEKGRKCLSKEYRNARIKLEWKCEEGHIFERSLSHIKEGRGCSVCKK